MIPIRQSHDADLAAILAWLKLEYDRAGTGTGFWCNRSIVEQAHDDGRLVVADDGDTDRAVAFQVGGLLHPGILEVRPDKRRMGFGRRLVEYCIARAKEDDECVLHIDCRPVSSVPFWKGMGFHLFSDAFGERCPSEFRNHAFRVLERSHTIASTGRASVPVDVCFRAESGTILSEVHTFGAQCSKRILLHERVISYGPTYVFELGDTFVDVHVNGRELYSDKAKYPEAAAIGVQARGGGVYLIDELIMPRSVGRSPEHGSEEAIGHES